jgi:hypothetical protein
MRVPSMVRVAPASLHLCPGVQHVKDVDELGSKANSLRIEAHQCILPQKVDAMHHIHSKGWIQVLHVAYAMQCKTRKDRHEVKTPNPSN